MANLSERQEINHVGKFYVTTACIDCDLCRETAPAFFTRSEDSGYSYVQNQPGTEEENDLCMEAAEGCPVEAIGHNGDQIAN
jgi:ferredoxin